MMIIRVFIAPIAGLLCALLLGCGIVPHTITLASGQHIKVTEEKFDTFKDDDGVENKMFDVSYETSLSLDDKTALRTEMAEVFLYYLPRIEREGAIKANFAPGKPCISAPNGCWEFAPFYLDRRPSGKWILE